MDLDLMDFCKYSSNMMFFFVPSGSARFEEPVFLVLGPHQSERYGDGSVSPVGSPLPHPAQPQPDSRDRGHPGSSAHLCATATTPQYQTDPGKSAPTYAYTYSCLGLDPWNRCWTACPLLPFIQFRQLNMNRLMWNNYHRNLKKQKWARLTAIQGAGSRLH